MWISSTSVKRPVFATVVNIVLIVLGVAAFMSLQVRQYPDVDPPVVSVQTTYRGASAQVIDAEVTKRLLDQLSGIEGIRTIESTSSDESSRINIEFTLDRDLDLAAADVRDQIARARRNLPTEAEDPIVTKASSDASPMMWISLTSETLSPLELTDYAIRQLEEPLSLVSGVAQVRVGGARRPSIRVWLDRGAMAATGITVDDISARLEAENIELPAGRVESFDREFTVRALSRLRTPDEFSGLVIRDPVGAMSRVRLGDVARVEVAAENDRTDFRVNGRTAVSLGIIRQSNANTIDVADAVRAELQILRETLPDGVQLQIASDDSIFIKASISEVIQALGIAVVLVFLVILVFVGSIRAVVVPSVSIPVSIVATTIVLAMLGYSINVLTLLAAVLAIGLVVDDAIVVLENIDRRIKGGEPPLLAAVRGSSEVGFAVIATTVVLVAVFVPLAFLTGTVGRLFNEFGVALAAAVCFSSFVALTMGPMLCSKLLKGRPPGDRKSGWFARRLSVLTRIGNRILAGYAWAVGGAIRIRWAMPLIILAIGGSAYFLFTRLPRELTPVEDQGRFIINVEAPEGASLDYTREQVLAIEAMLQPYIDNNGPIERVISIVAPGWGGAANVNSARMIVRLRPWEYRDVSQQRIVADLFPRLSAMPGVRAFPINPAGLGVRGASQPISYAVGGPDFESARQYAQIVADAVRDDPLFNNLRADFEDTSPQLQITIDRDRAINLGLNVQQIGRALQTFLGGREVTEFFDRGELYEVILQAAPDDRRDPADLDSIYVRSSTTGELIPLGSVVTLSEAGTVRDLRRINRAPSVVITGSVGPGGSLAAALERLDDVARTQLPPDARISYLGESLEYRDASGQLYITFALAVLIVYLALAGQFESFIHPLTILIAVPLAVTGGLASLMVMGFSLNIYSQIGLILLVGLMAKNGILVVEFANQLRGRGMGAREAAKEAAVLRLRPILMTTISTVLGAIPLVTASGAGAEGRQAIGVVVIGGMTFASALTLFIVPAMYALLAARSKPANHVEVRLAKLEAEAATAGPSPAADAHAHSNGHRANGTHRPEPTPPQPSPQPPVQPAPVRQRTPRSPDAD